MQFTLLPLLLLLSTTSSLAADEPAEMPVVTTTTSDDPAEPAESRGGDAVATTAVMTSSESHSEMTLSGIIMIILLSLLFVHAVVLYFWLWRKCCPRASDKPTAPDTDSGLRIKARWLLLFLTAVALAFSLTALASCHFLVIDGVVDDYDVGMGIFRYKEWNGVDDNVNCKKYPESFRSDYFDAGIELARIEAVAGSVFLGISFVLECLLQMRLLGDSRCTWNLARCATYLAFYCTCFTFFILGWDFCKDRECSLGSAGVVNVFGVVVLVPAIIVGFFVNSSEVAQAGAPAMEESAMQSSPA